MTLEKFSQVRRRSELPMVSISRKRFQLNSACRKQYFKGKKFAELYFDKDEKTVGIKPLEKETECSFIIRTYSDRSISVISASGFIKHFKLEDLISFVNDEPGKEGRERSLQVSAEWSEKNKMVMLRLP